MTASVTQTENGFTVVGSENLTYGFTFIDGVFDPASSELASIYKKWGRVLLVTDGSIEKQYGDIARAYFAAHNIALTLHVMPGGEINKTMTTMLSLVDAFEEFGLIRKEPVLALGGGLVTDVCGFACASYRRSSNFIRIPTTVIGLIDAAVSIKVGVNHEKLKNRLGAYHAPSMTFLDFTFLKTLPIGQVRNGFAELIKISSVYNLKVWELLRDNGVELIETRFGRADGASAEIKRISDIICKDGIKTMLDLETPNLHEIGLDRVIAFGHTWSPTLELTPTIPLRHGHAICIDMAYSTTLSYTRGNITATERDEILGLMSRVGLSLDHPLFDEALLVKGTAAILQTRDGSQRFVLPSPIGFTKFANDVPMSELHAALAVHKALCKDMPRGGAGLESIVDTSDLGCDPQILIDAAEAKLAALKVTVGNGVSAAVSALSAKIAA